MPLSGTIAPSTTTYDDLAQFLVERDVQLERIVTHRFPIERGVEAIELFDTRRTGKVVFEYP